MTETMPAWVQIMIAISTAVVSGSALMGFWVWARRQITLLTAEVATVKAEVASIQYRCAERQEHLTEIFVELRKVGQGVAHLQGQLDK